MAAVEARRRSPSVFDPAHTLGEADLAQLFEAARWSPSAGNSQPWKFLVTLRGDDAHRRLIPHLSRGNTSWVPRASAVLISLAQVGSEPDRELLYDGEYSAYDLGQAAAHLTVQAESMGLHVHQFAGFDHEAVTAAYGVSAAWQVTTGIAIGRWWPPAERVDVDERTADREHKPRHRRPVVETFVRPV